MVKLPNQEHIKSYYRWVEYIPGCSMPRNNGISKMERGKLQMPKQLASAYDIRFDDRTALFEKDILKENPPKLWYLTLTVPLCFFHRQN